MWIELRENDLYMVAHFNRDIQETVFFLPMYSLGYWMPSHNCAVMRERLRVTVVGFLKI